jgi:intracellular sulfur oxidation DsrE/DsrF family protein
LIFNLFKNYFFMENSRRKFLNKLSAGAALTGMSSYAQILQAATPLDPSLVPSAEEWHKIAYDGPEPHDAFPIIWTWAFYLSNNGTGVDDSDMTGVCVLRHNAIPFAFKDELWKKYKLGEMFGIQDNIAKAPSTRNPYYEPKEGDYPLPGIDGIKKLQERGAMFCVCNLAIAVMSGFAAQAMGMNAEEVKEEWLAGVLPGIQLAPSGVWALGRAQELGCGYIYAGG